MISSKKTGTKPPQQEATVQSLARDPNFLGDESSTASGSPAILDRIKKCMPEETTGTFPRKKQIPGGKIDGTI